MLRLIRKRLLQLVIVLILQSIVTFTLMKLAPGDPVHAILQADELTVTEGDKAKLREELGFQDPVLVQYGRWAWGLLHLDLGNSYIKGKPVWMELMDRLPVTLELAFYGMLVMLLISVPLGVAAARYPGQWPDHLGRGLALAGVSLPGFWLGLLLIYLFSYKLEFLPSMGMGSFSHILLPSFTLGFTLSVVYARMLRTGLLESLSQDYIRAARARGVTERRILLLHALRSALLPVVTMFGMGIGSFLGGSVVVETLFSWPGLGSMAVDAIFSRDYPVIQGYVLLTGVFVITANLLVDLTYGWLDPRIRMGEEMRR